MDNFLSLAQKNKRLAAIQCIRLLGQTDPEKVTKETNGLYSHTNKRGKKRFMLVCSTYAEYAREQKVRPNAKLSRCVGYYVLHWA